MVKLGTTVSVSSGCCMKLSSDNTFNVSANTVGKRVDTWYIFPWFPSTKHCKVQCTVYTAVLYNRKQHSNRKLTQGTLNISPTIFPIPCCVNPSSLGLVPILVLNPIASIQGYLICFDPCLWGLPWPIIIYIFFNDQQIWQISLHNPDYLRCQSCKLVWRKCTFSVPRDKSRPRFSL